MAPDTAEPGLDATPEPPVAPAAPPPTAAAAPPPAANASAAATPAAPPFAGPGAYVPPPPAPAIPAGPPAPAREWAGHGPEPDGRSGPAARSGSAASKDPSDARARLAEFVRWLSVAGASFASVGFLLPWGLVLIGSNGVGYFDRWGLAGPGHVIVVVGLLAVLALGLIANGIPIWIRTGLAGLGLGTLVLGLIWPYLLGPLGSGPGAVIVGVGAVALAISGLLALVTDRGDRHAEVDRSV